MEKKIIIKGAKEHNLKNVNLELPRDKFIVFTGISGSGKSTLAFDTIFAEGQRRYLESLSSYARQFLGQMKKPDVEYIEGLSPTISIEQKSRSHNPRSTVGTVTEIYDYLRLLFAKIGRPFCPDCGIEIESLTIDQIANRVFDAAQGKMIGILAPVVRGRKGEYLKMLSDMYERGFSKAVVNGEEIELEEAPKLKLARYKKHDISILIDTVKVSEENIERIFDDIEQSLKLADGLVDIRIEGQKKMIGFNQKLSCKKCGYNFPEIEPRLFSFNSPYGACPDCNGLGTNSRIDEKLVIPDDTKTISEGGIMPWTYSARGYYGNILKSLCEKYNISPNTRIKNIAKKKIDNILYGESEPITIKFSYWSQGVKRSFFLKFNGLMNHLEERYKKTDSESVRKEIQKYMSVTPCSECEGKRLKKEALHVRIGKKELKNMAEITGLPVSRSKSYFDTLELEPKEKMIADRIMKEVRDRLSFLDNVGLGYLTLDRTAMTLSGGESQRIRLASQIGAALMGVLYVLDEPSIGLHARDNIKLLETLEHLRDIGNTLIVIEHDEETMRRADWIVDIGPRAGRHGGEIMSSGPLETVLRSERSLTAQYLSGQRIIPVPSHRRKIKDKFLSIKGASHNNLKNINVHIPLGVFNCITGVSGSGKSSLVNDILYKALARHFHGSMEKPGKYAKLEGLEHIDKVIIIDQSPIGRTPRSNPATYTGLFTPIRDLFSRTTDARARGYLPGRFSFNVAGGRCEACKGDGFLKVEMQFLPDVYVPCDVCKGKRYNSETLKVHYKNKNIAQVLDMTVSEALDFFGPITAISDKLKLLNDVGLGYIHLGQAATTLSGGEAQRVKLASELSRRDTGKTLYILDEPTSGLHFDDIQKLLDVLNRLVDAGNTAVIIEHNLDVIKSADWVIDLGPEGGEKGGKIIVAGDPEEVAKYEESYTGQYLKEVL